MCICDAVREYAKKEDINFWDVVRQIGKITVASPVQTVSELLGKKSWINPSDERAVRRFLSNKEQGESKSK